MEAGEIAAIVVVAVVLVVATVFLCFRCWRAVGEVVEDDQKPKRQTFIGSVKDGLRRSFRSSVRRMSSIRNSFRRSGGRGSKGRGKVSVQDAAAAAGRRPNTVTTIQGLAAEASQIHPMYLKKNIKNEEAGNVPRGTSALVDSGLPPGTRLQSCDDPTSGFGGSIKTAPSLSDLAGQQVNIQSYPNPLYNGKSREPTPDRAKATGLQKVKSHLSGYKQMAEDIDLDPHAHQHGPYDHRYVDQGHQGGYGYDQPRPQPQGGFTNANYQADSPNHQPYARYDAPFDEAVAQNASQVQRVVYESQKEAVSLPADTEARNVQAESTYI